jgi:hypothetical protein
MKVSTSQIDLLHQIDHAVESEDFGHALQLIDRNWEHQADPAPLRERAAMVLASMGSKREAVEIYQIVARHYANAGFPTRALAAIKQMQALNPSSTQLLDHFTTLYSVRSPFLERHQRQGDLPGPTAAPSLDTDSDVDVDELVKVVIARAKDDAKTAERPGSLPALPLLSWLPPKALRRLLDFVEYEIYAETQAIVGSEQDEDDLFWAVGSDLILSEGDQRFRVPSGALLGLSRFAGFPTATSHSVISQKGSECLRLSQKALQTLNGEFPDFPNRLTTLFRHALTEGLLWRHPLFADLDQEARDEIPSQLLGLKLDAQTCIIRQGKVSPGLYIVLDGALELVRESTNGDRLIDTRGPGEVVGEIGLIDPRPSVITARTTEPTHLLFFERDAFVGFADDHRQITGLSQARADAEVNRLRQKLEG